ncbi:MAG TPA: NPCBM/NEW2 domain-containing protein [Humisphaera sp.]|nr:NPCBM/NEW2 domain-containing protein [Humisphaera sp.]
MIASEKRPPIMFVPENKQKVEPHVIFRLVGDGKTLWESQEMVRGENKVQPCWVTITGVKELSLVVHCPGSNGAWAWGVWLDPQVLR